jgi:hypothetical protein
MLSVHNIAAASDNNCFEHWHEVTCRNYSVTEYRRPVIGPFRGQIAAGDLFIYGRLILICY